MALVSRVLQAWAAVTSGRRQPRRRRGNDNGGDGDGGKGMGVFGSFGEVSSVRMPKKFDGKHRGFAFIEYLSNQDAAKAMDALGNTHLYGRHLSMDALRDKAKRNLDASQKATDAKRLRAAKAGDEMDVEFDRDGDAGMADQMLAY
ncbi:hypothetical protein T492DRAFT_877496 [Pavlovales sp. CCMP2436]|nr:hypothetical protein T492DRAFT_877496 [Pavlovales sp. CCMP2436]